MPTIQDVAEYWNRQPCCSRHSPAPPDTLAYFEQTAQRRYFVQPHILPFADFSRWKGRRVLEIGCGIGTDAAEFAKAGADYIGIDLSEASVEIARRRFSCLGLPGKFVVGDIERLTEFIAPCKYDLVYSFGVLHHTPNPEVVVHDLRNYMQPGSEFRLMLYARDSWKAIMIDAELDQHEAQAKCPIAKTYTRREVGELLVDFSVFIDQDHIFPYRVEDYKEFRYVLQPWFSAMESGMFRALEKHLGWHLLIKAMQSASS